MISNINIFKMFCENISCPIWIRGIDGRYEYVNKAYLDFRNLKADEIIGNKSEDIFPKYIAAKFNEQINKIVETLEPTEYESMVEGRHKKCYLVPLLDDLLNLVAVGGLIVDINDRMERELELEEQKNLLRTIIDSIPDVIFYKDKESKYIGCNKACSDFYKKRGIDNIIGKSDIEINTNKELAQKFMDKDKEIMKSKISIVEEARFPTLSGDIEYKESFKAPAIDKNGEAWGIVGLVRDITEKKKLERRLKYLSYTDILTGTLNRSSFEENIYELNVHDNLPLGIIMGDINGLKLINDTFGHLEGDELIKSISNVLNEVCNNKGKIFRWGGDEFVILLPNTNEPMCESIISQIKHKCKGARQQHIQLSISLGEAVKYSVDKDIYECLKEAEEKVYRQKLLESNSVRSSIMNSLKTSLEVKSMETEDHTERLVKYALKIGDKLNLKSAEIDELVLVTKLHDIGKITIDENILLKPGNLTDKEFEIMKSHTESGYRIVKATNELHNVAMGVLTHHERWDGKGYPLGLEGEKIPLYARVVSVVDSYDAMTNDRVYQKAKSQEHAIKEIKNCSGTQFDPKIVNLFLQCLKSE